LYFKDLWIKKKALIITAIICFVLLIPFIQFLLTPESKLRFNEVNIFSDSTIVAKANKAIQNEGNTIFAKTIHNRRVLYTLEYLKHYFDFFNPDFLFIRGDVNPRFSHQENGELYLWELPLILAGMYFLITSKRKEAILIFGWLLLAPVAGATARETPHALRGETFLPIYELFSALGAVFIFTSIFKYSRKIATFTISVFAIVIGLSLFLFQYNYFIDYPYLYSEVWQDGYKTTIEKVKKIEDQYDKIVVTNTYGRPYAYVLFYGDIPPGEFWADSDVRKDQFGLYNVYRVGKYYFPEEFVLEKDTDKKVLYVGAPNEIPSGSRTIDTINFLNGKPAFVLSTE